MDWLNLSCFTGGALVGALTMAVIAWRRITLVRRIAAHHHGTVERMVRCTAVRGAA